jgi:hypothetical protein
MIAGELGLSSHGKVCAAPPRSTWIDTHHSGGTQLSVSRHSGVRTRNVVVSRVNFFKVLLSRNLWVQIGSECARDIALNNYLSGIEAEALNFQRVRRTGSICATSTRDLHLSLASASALFDP